MINITVSNLEKPESQSYDKQFKVKEPENQKRDKERLHSSQTDSYLDESRVGFYENGQNNLDSQMLDKKNPSTFDSGYVFPRQPERTD